MRDFEPGNNLTPDKEISIKDQQYNMQRQYQIWKYPGQTLFRVNKATHEVEDMPKLKKYAEVNKAGETIIRNDVLMDEEKYFYCVALNKRNALRHYRDYLNKVENFMSRFNNLMDYLGRKYPDHSRDSLIDAINIVTMVKYELNPVVAIMAHLKNYFILKAKVIVEVAN